MEIDRGDICRYLDFLRDEPGYCITLHGEPAEWPEFVRYNFHPNPYCHYVNCVRMLVGMHCAPAEGDGGVPGRGFFSGSAMPGWASMCIR